MCAMATIACLLNTRLDVSCSTSLGWFSCVTLRSLNQWDFGWAYPAAGYCFFS
jgi:hypothetical protein